MSINFLLFRGSRENEGNFCLLETEKSIILLAVGKDLSSKTKTEKQEQQIGKNYLKEKKAKVKAILINNTNLRNINFLEEVCGDLGYSVPIYSSFQSRSIINKIFPSLRNKINIVDKDKKIQIDDDIEINFYPLKSYLIGNLAIKISYLKQNFYLFEGFVSSYLFEGDNSFPRELSSDSPDFEKFLSKGEENYLITSLQGIHWRNNNSLFFAENSLPSSDSVIFFIIYDYDWIHIIELLEIVKKWGKKIRVLNGTFLNLLKKILIRNPLLSVVLGENNKEESKIFLLIVSKTSNIKEEVETSLKDVKDEKLIPNANFVVFTAPIIGEASKIAKLIDFLYTKSEKIIDFSRKDYSSSGINFYDFKLLLQLLKPNKVITLQNSYKNANFFNYLPKKNFIFMENGHSLNFPDKRISRLKIKDSLISLDELIVKQRKVLGEVGIILVIAVVYWEAEELKLKEVKVKQVSIGSSLITEKLESKIKNWWPIKIARDLRKDEKAKTLKRIIEKRISDKVISHLLQERDIKIHEPLIFIFNRDKETGFEDLTNENE